MIITVNAHYADGRPALNGCAADHPVNLQRVGAVGAGIGGGSKIAIGAGRIFFFDGDFFVVKSPPAKVTLPALCSKCVPPMAEPLTVR